MEFNSQYPQTSPHLPSNPNPPQSPWAAEPASVPAPQPQPQQWQQQAYEAPAPVPQQQWQAPAPVEVQAPTPAPAVSPLNPMPVVRVLSPVGVEYLFLTILLFVSAGALMGILLLLVNGGTEFSSLAFPTATLVVSLPLFAVLFLRLKKMELRNPALQLDPSKRRSTQFTQAVAFIVSLFTLIGLVFSIFAKLGGQSSVSIGKAFLDALCVLAVAGGILYYYWRDEHKNNR
ncbi:MAG TPA: hypothetical protein VLI54_05085 [Bacillota bacterium]|nr:hypothetical protein [Bacillota bacterium]